MKGMGLEVFWATEVGRVKLLVLLFWSIGFEEIV